MFSSTLSVSQLLPCNPLASLPWLLTDVAAHVGIQPQCRNTTNLNLLLAQCALKQISRPRRSCRRIPQHGADRCWRAPTQLHLCAKCPENCTAMWTAAERSEVLLHVAFRSLRLIAFASATVPWSRRNCNGTPTQLFCSHCE